MLTVTSLLLDCGFLYIYKKYGKREIAQDRNLGSYYLVLYLNWKPASLSQMWITLGSFHLLFGAVSELKIWSPKKDFRKLNVKYPGIASFTHLYFSWILLSVFSYSIWFGNVVSWRRVLWYRGYELLLNRISYLFLLFLNPVIYSHDISIIFILRLGQNNDFLKMDFWMLIERCSRIASFIYFYYSLIASFIYSCIVRIFHRWNWMAQLGIIQWSSSSNGLPAKDLLPRFRKFTVYKECFRMNLDEFRGI